MRWPDRFGYSICLFKAGLVIIKNAFMKVAGGHPRRWAGETNGWRVGWWDGGGGWGGGGVGGYGGS